MQKQFVLWVATLFISLPLISFGTWQLANPEHHSKMMRDIDPELAQTDQPSQFYEEAKYVIYLKKGSLKTNLNQFAENCHWHISWQALENYHVLSNSKIAGPSFASTLDRVLAHYPLRAEYNYKTCAATILPKTPNRYSK